MRGPPGMPAAVEPPVAKNIVVCCDGTNNIWKDSGQTNVVKLVRALPKASAQQVYYYDPGVGSIDGLLAGDGDSPLREKLVRVAGLAWGRGVWTNVAEAYTFLMRHYVPGDRIYCFGFSRGAFTARAVAGLVSLAGVLDAAHANLIPTLVRVYRMRADDPRRKAIADSLSERFATRADVHFVGCWDTVESVGLPSILPGFGQRITSDPTQKPAMAHIRHAVAIDEQRGPYAPRLYEPDARGNYDGEERSFKQVWFPGAHSDVGGGYGARNDGLANVALHWMAREAAAKGLHVDLAALALDHPPDALAYLHDEMLDMPWWSLVGYHRRAYPAAGAVLHEAVQERIYDPRFAYYPPIARKGEPERTRPLGAQDQARAETLAANRASAASPKRISADEARTREASLERVPLLWGLVFALLGLVLLAKVPFVAQLACEQAPSEATRRITDSFGLCAGHALPQAALGPRLIEAFAPPVAKLGTERAALEQARQSVRRALVGDTLLIVLYVLAIPVALVVALFIGGRGYPPRRLGRFAMIAMLGLVGADLAENLASLFAIASVDAPQLGLFSAPLWQWAWTALGVIATLIKLLCTIALLVLIGWLVVRALFGAFLRWWQGNAATVPAR